MNRTETLGDIPARNLCDLARDHTAESRGNLADTLSARLDGGDHGVSDYEKSLIFDILRKVVSDIDVSIRGKIALRFAERADVPAELITMLANDRIEVAFPVLKRSALLNDEDLVEVVRQRSREHRLAIAARDNLSVAVTDALIDSGNRSVIVALLNNPNASISEAMLSYLVDQSQRVDNFREPVLRRQELSGDLAKRLFLWVSAALRMTIINRYAFDAETVDDLIEQVVTAECGAAESGPMGPEDVIAELVQGNGSGDLLTASLERGEVALFLALFSRMTGIPRSTAFNLLFEVDHGELAMICKAIGLKRRAVAALLICVCTAKRGLPHAKGNAAPADFVAEADRTRALAVFDGSSMESSSRALRRWRRNPEYLAAIDNVARTCSHDVSVRG